jgi:cell division protein FtsL
MTDRIIEVLEEIRELQRRLLDSHQIALRNQQEAIQAQREAFARGRKLQLALGIVIAVVLVIVLVLLKYVIQYYS